MLRVHCRLRTVVYIAVAMLLAAGSRAAAQDGAPPLTLDTALVQNELARPAPLRTASTQRSALVPLYVSFGVMQVLDMHSTDCALDGGGREGNPMMQGVVGSPIAMLALKAGTTTGIIYLTQKLRKRHPGAAIALMVALDSAYAVVVSRNYSIARR
jgi:Domain of unknown function (DUF5658)